MTGVKRTILHSRAAMGAAIVFLALGLAASAVAQTTAQTAVWKPYSYPADGFQASYPSAPQIEKKSIPTDAGSFELRSYIVQDGDVALFIGVCDYGAQAAGKDPDTMLQGAKNGALQNSSSHLLTEKKITFGIYHGLQFTAASDANDFTARVYMVGNTLYQTLVVTPLGKPYAATTKFLDSFQLMARTSN